MIIKTGVDLVYLPKFKTSFKRGGDSFLRRVFREEELDKSKSGNIERQIQHLAGIFAAKEALMKALGLPLDCWQDILITKDKKGVPQVTILHHQLHIHSHSLSISHDQDYVIAQYVVILKSNAFNKT